MSLVRAAVLRPVTTVASTLAVVLLGSVSARPDCRCRCCRTCTLPVLTIRTLYPGAAAEEVSRFVAEPVEEAIAATPGLVELRSVSRNGEEMTTARFAWGTDMQTTLLNVRERLDNARGQLPERAERPTLLTSDPGERPIAVLALTTTGDLRRPRPHRRGRARAPARADRRRRQRRRRRRTRRTRSASSVTPERMRALGLTPDDVATADHAPPTSMAPGGTIRRGQFRFSVRTLTEFRSPDEIARRPDRARRARGINLRDLATVTIDDRRPEDAHAARRPARPWAWWSTRTQAPIPSRSRRRSSGSSAQLGKEFPTIGLTIVAAQADFVVDALSNLGQEIILGGALSILVILLFLRDWRMSLAIGRDGPAVGAGGARDPAGADVTINVLSLGGLALGVGLLVDNAIVVAEAAVRKREEGHAAEDATHHGHRGGRRARSSPARSPRCWCSGRSSSCAAWPRRSSATCRCRW